MSRFINVHMNVDNARKSYNMKRRKYLGPKDIHALVRKKKYNIDRVPTIVSRRVEWWFVLKVTFKRLVPTYTHL